MPPVARIMFGHLTSFGLPSKTIAPVTCPSSVSISIRYVLNMKCRFLRSRAISPSLLVVSRPVASPPQWTMRRQECPPSRVINSSPSGFVSNGTFISTSSFMFSGPSLTRVSTAARSHSPAPALMVSSTCDSKWSFGSMTAAMPPCASHEFDFSKSTLLIIRTCLSGSICRAE